MNAPIERGWFPGMVGDVSSMHGRYYAREWHLEPSFEFRVARELCEYFEHYDVTSDVALSVRDGERTVGFIAISRNRVELFEANLRWFIVDDGMRGKGLGRALLDAALAHCREIGIRRLELFTFDSLAAARALYRNAGFTTVEQKPDDQWGPTINFERHELRFTTRDIAGDGEPPR